MSKSIENEEMCWNEYPEKLMEKAKALKENT